MESFKRYRTRSTQDVTQEEPEVERTIKTIRFGEYEIETWFHSPYPDGFERPDDGKIFLCHWCLLYFNTKPTLRAHLGKCDLRCPPGLEIYRDKEKSVFRVDGQNQKMYCQNLCLLAKLFLDHKTLYYDVSAFLFYVVTENTVNGCRIVGYFSKEKSSKNILSCILTLPCYHRRGFGSFMMSFAYALCQKLKVVGSPEKPLSALGLHGFRAYWTACIIDFVNKAPSGSSFTIEDISNKTSIALVDIISTLVGLGAITFHDRTASISLPSTLRTTLFSKLKNIFKNRVDPKKIDFDPKLFAEG
eukprot:GCRY01009109.1.p1 GENE.GCRY01009109.1~~GCRY01009109.1.p1  ORF type:complete len:302 (+),score=29.22 GCRY01009109.1:146-1051(+)